MMDRLWALSAAVTVSLLVSVSPFEINMVVLRGDPARVASVLYIVALLSVATRPDDWRLHVVTMAAGFVFWLGRGASFLERAWVDSSFWGATALNMLLVPVTVAVLHLSAIERLAAKSHRVRRSTDVD